MIEVSLRPDEGRSETGRNVQSRTRELRMDEREISAGNWLLDPERWSGVRPGCMF